MKVAIAGGGKLGLTITEALLESGTAVTMIDTNPELLEKVSNQADLMTLNVSGLDTGALRDLRIEDYDYLVATTGNDEKNILICSFAKKLGCPNVIARVRDPEHVNHGDFIKEAMGIDYIVNPDLSIANEIYKYLVEKYNLSNGFLPIGNMAIIQFNIDMMPELIGRAIREIPSFLGNKLVVAMSRSGKIIIPTGETVLYENDDLYVLGERDPILRLNEKVHEKNPYTDLQKVMIAGGGKTGYYLAKFLSDFGVNVKIIEKDRGRCQYLSEHLDNVMILHGDATDVTLLEEENIDEMDAFVTLTGFDEENLLLALLASQRNIEDVVAKVNRKGYIDLVEKMGISMALNPLDMTATNILRYIQGTKRTIFSKIIQGQAEFLEIVAEGGMKILNTPLSKLTLPPGVIIAAIHRGEKTIIPRGDTEIRKGDYVVFLSMLTSIPKLEGLLQARRWSFR